MSKLAVNYEIAGKADNAKRSEKAKSEFHFFASEITREVKLWQTGYLINTVVIILAVIGGIVVIGWVLMALMMGSGMMGGMMLGGLALLAVIVAAIVFFVRRGKF